MDGTLLGTSSLFGNMAMMKFRAVLHCSSLSRENLYALSVALPDQIGKDDSFVL